MSGGKRIFVIDDSEILLSRMKRALSAEGYDVIVSNRPAVSSSGLENCELVIIDYHMPGIDGGTVLQMTKKAVLAHPLQECLFYVYTSDPTIANNFEKLGFDGAFSDKGDNDALVRQVGSVFRMLKIRALSPRAKPPRGV